MFAVLDPWLLHVDDTRGLSPLPLKDLEDLTWMLTRRGAVIPAISFYWQ